MNKCFSNNKIKTGITTVQSNTFSKQREERTTQNWPNPRMNSLCLKGNTCVIVQYVK